MGACYRGTAPDKPGLILYFVPLLALIQAGPGCHPGQQQMKTIISRLQAKHDIFRNFSDTAKGPVIEIAADIWRICRAVTHEYINRLGFGGVSKVGKASQI